MCYSFRCFAQVSLKPPHASPHRIGSRFIFEERVAFAAICFRQTSTDSLGTGGETSSGCPGDF